jgi:hypothetical protein
MANHLDIHFSPTSLTIQQVNGRSKVWDDVRKKWLLLTPEELVRQSCVQYLMTAMQYPTTKIAIEKSLLYNGRLKRFDIVVYDKTFKPWMLIECKRPEVPITEQTLFQATQYLASLNAPYVWLTNGVHNYCAHIDEGTLNWLFHLPSYDTIDQSLL